MYTHIVVCIIIMISNITFSCIIILRVFVVSGSQSLPDGWPPRIGKGKLGSALTGPLQISCC